MAFLNKTLALTYEEDGKWQLATDKDSVISGKGFASLISLIKNKYSGNQVVIWNYQLSEQIAWTNEEDYSRIERHSLRSFTIKFAEVDNIIFKNLKEFYRLSLSKIAQQKHINSANELTITWLAAESERLRNEGYVSKIPKTAIGYVRRELDGLAEFPRLASSITEETHKLISECKSGGLCGISEADIDIPKRVNCYDFKSFYPWIMVSQKFPWGRYAIHKNLSSFGIYKDKLWIARIKFKYIKPKRTNWLKIINNEIVITSLDFKIIEEDYYYEVEEILEIIPFITIDFLPKDLRDYIISRFQIKETYDKDTEEYEQAKIFLNSIYGLFCQDPNAYGKEIDCWSAKQRPLVIGKFVAAYGRYYLWSIMYKSNPIHWDTDGFKTEEELNLTKFNQMRKIKGSRLGRLIQEESWAKVIVFGNKQYMINDKLKLAGTDGDLAKEYFDKIGVKPRSGLTIDAEYTSQVRIVGNKIIKVPYTIGGDI